jgi:hypothetical protein
MSLRIVKGTRAEYDAELEKLTPAEREKSELITKCQDAISYALYQCVSAFFKDVGVPPYPEKVVAAAFVNALEEVGLSLVPHVHECFDELRIVLASDVEAQRLRTESRENFDARRELIIRLTKEGADDKTIKERVLELAKVQMGAAPVEALAS